jgi:hypothetical protein
LSLTTANENIAAINAELVLLNQQYASLLEKLNAILALLNSPPPTILDGLVSYYQFNGNFLDSNTTFTKRNGVGFGVFDFTSDRFGFANKAIRFSSNTFFFHF